jgi:ABC-type lipoprotein release transport system permease subunit
VFFKLGWRNIWRNPRRTIIVASSIAVGLAGCAVSMAIQLGMMSQMVDTAIATGLGHVQIHAPGWDEQPELELNLPAGAEDLAPLLENDEDILAWAPRVRGDGLVASPRSSAGVAIMGVDPQREGDVSLVEAHLTSGAWFDGSRKILIGEALARRLRVGLGDKVVVTGQDLEGELTGQAYRVGGLFRTPVRELDEGTALLPIHQAQELFGLGDAVSELVVIAVSRDRVDAIGARLSREVGRRGEVRTWGELEPMLVYMVQSFDSMAWITYAAVFVAMAFGIANVLMMAVFERLREIGVMRAIGISRRRVIALVVYESTLLTILGLLAGAALTALGLFVFRDGIDIGRYASELDAYGIGTKLVPLWRREDATLPVVIATVTAILASFWPAVRAARTPPAEALRGH